MAKVGTPARRGEIQGLQFVRAFAVLLVVLYHSAADLGPGHPEYFNTQFWGGALDNGFVGVQLFFVLSGFIIVYVTLKKRTLEPKTGVGDFLLKRFVRIVPFLWVSVAAYAVFRAAGTGRLDWRPYFNAAFLVPVAELRPNVVWTLRCEALFYILFALTFLLRRRAHYILYAWFIAPAVMWVAGKASGVNFFANDYVAFVFDTRVNFFFGCGMLICLICLKHDLPRAPLAASRPVVAVGLLAALSAATFLTAGWLPGAAAASSAAIIVGLLTPASRGRLARAWELCGDASYCTYLTHSMVILIGASAWVHVFGRQNYTAAVFSLVIASMIAGVVVHLLVEKPVVRLARNGIERLRRRPLRSAQAVAP